MYKYICLNPIAQVGLDGFNDNFTKVEDVNDADGILVRSAKMHDMTIPKNVLCVTRAGVGVDNIPLSDCAKNGVVVFNTPGANANGVKELVFAGMLLASRDIIGGIEWVKENKDDPEIAKKVEKEKKRFAGHEIDGKKLGVIGLGAIGVRVANAARHLGLEVYGYDPYISVGAAWALDREVNHVMSSDELFSECDFITTHVPLVESTKNIIDEKAIEKMKKGVCLLNFSRDLVYDEEAILKGIEAGKIGKYVTDFPNTITSGKNNCIVIPHLGASTEESEDNCAKMAVKEMKNYLENGNINNSVNYPNCDMGVCSSIGRVAIIHKNIVNMVAQLSSVFSAAGVNIAKMANASKGEYAYTMMDVENHVLPEFVEKLEGINGVIRVRVIK